MHALQYLQSGRDRYSMRLFVFCRKRSRFDDPDEKMSPSGENLMDTGNMSPSQLDAIRGLKDERPVFERLKSLAEGWSTKGLLLN